METEGAKVLWDRSIEKHDIRYKWMVSDGDSKAFNAVEDITLSSAFKFTRTEKDGDLLIYLYNSQRKKTLKILIKTYRKQYLSRQNKNKSIQQS